MFWSHTTRELPFRPVHNTVFLVMQNEAGAKKWPATDAFEQDVLNTYGELAKDVKENALASRT